MSAYKSFAVVGAGTLGLPVLNALAAAQDVSVILLSRPGSTTKTVSSGVEVIPVDFADAAAVAAVLKKKSLVDAAKLAAVKLFVPSEYGLPTEGHTDGPLGAKNQIAVYLKSSGIPSTRIFIGAFPEFIPWLVNYSPGGKFSIVGKGETPVSFTSIPDIAGFVAYVLTTLPPSELEDRILRLEGDRSNLKDIAAQFKASVEHVDSIAGEMGEFKTSLQHATNTGAGSTGWDPVKKAEGTGSNAAGSANALWPGHQWQSIKEVHNL
ncbi:NmrA domain-containing protein [Mycena venus]|uniref:NmrA domain-containing protein n=1 Tax=Mycena venus TaxID=2733690 RepID=A0A8H6XIM6_9AGAR|nr:NmrA domain-containing protein [Mycena venus]